MKQNKQSNKSNLSIIKEQSYIQEMFDFLNTFYTFSKSHVTAYDLKQHFLSYLNISKEEMSEKRFSTLMTTIINNSDLNSFDITRKALRSDTSYRGIKLKHLS